MADEGPKKSLFREKIEEAVSLTNLGLSKLEQISKNIQAPVVQSFGKIGKDSHRLLDVASSAYDKRREYAPQIIASCVVSTGAMFTLRRGRVAGILGASVAGAAAYSFVYDKISVTGVFDSFVPKED